MRMFSCQLEKAEQVWLARLKGEDSSGLPIWPALGLADCEAWIRENRDGYAAFLSGLKGEDLAKTVTYRNSSGTAFNTAIGDILAHVAMHGAYHRGQVSMIMRMEGCEPV